MGGWVGSSIHLITYFTAHQQRFPGGAATRQKSRSAATGLDGVVVVVAATRTDVIGKEFTRRMHRPQGRVSAPSTTRTGRPGKRGDAAGLLNIPVAIV